MSTGPETTFSFLSATKNRAAVEILVAGLDAADRQTRNRALAAAALAYAVEGEPDYGIAAAPAEFDWLPARPYVVCLTATSRDDKLWPEAHWQALGESLRALGYRAVLPGGK